MSDDQLKRLLQFLRLFKKHGFAGMKSEFWVKNWSEWIKEGDTDD